MAKQSDARNLAGHSITRRHLTGMIPVMAAASSIALPARLGATGMRGRSSHDARLSRLVPVGANGIEERWRLATAGNLWGSPVVANDLVYVFNTAGKGYIHAIDIRDGSERWVFSDAEWNHMTNYHVTVDGPVLAMGWNWDGILYALDAVDGAELWQTPIDSSPDELTYLDMIDGLVFICNRGEFLVLDGLNGAERWRVETDFWWNYRPSVAEGCVIVGNSDGTLDAFEIEDGSPRWQVTTNDELYAPVVANGMAFVGSESGTVYAFGTQDGQEQWRAATDAGVSTRLVVAETTVFTGTEDRNLHAFNTQDGSQLWRSSTGDETPEGILVSEGATIVRGDDRFLIALDAETGVERWRLTIDSEISSGLRVVEGVLYFGSYDGNVHAVDVAEGTEQWSFMIEHSVFSTPAVTDDLVIVTGWDTVNALGGRPARMEPGATARVATSTPLRAAPNPTAVERAMLDVGTIVTLTGESEARDGTTWWPVTVKDTGDLGWVDETALELEGAG